MPTLQWLTKEDDVRAARRVPYRLFEEVTDLRHGDAATGNMLIQGDNLEALKALLPYYAGKVKCIYIDPPYNTKSAFEQYDDSLEHSRWLAMIYPRLELLREFLSEEGSIWVTIDDNEGHYLKVVMDEVFGRGQFIANVVWQKRTSPEARLKLGPAHDSVLVYCRDPDRVALKKVPISGEKAENYKNLDGDPRGTWASSDFTAQGWRPNQMYKIKTPGGALYEPPKGRCWGNIESEFKRLLSDNRLWFGKDGRSRPRVKTFLSELEGISAWTWWPNSEVGHNQEAKKEILSLLENVSVFDTPKPERLIQRILSISTEAGDTVLDAFLGSGTTAAVAHKMGRHYIGVEMGDHAVTHCQPRLKKVVDGEQGGISESVGWKGGGGFRFYRLGVPVFDAEGRISPDIRFPVLAAHVWFSETGIPWQAKRGTPVLGNHDGQAYALLYNGILGDKSISGGNVLTRTTLGTIRKKLGDFSGPVTIYGERSALGAASLKRESITFKQTPYDVKVRV